ncbi:MAG TPA: SRPBCC family protein [Frankiaceae bacterium]|nr:SRPBCC family protein [Frankiaceae bacterium]
MLTAVAHAHVPATPEQVFGVLADGRSYAYWVLGARRIRSVDPGWPAPGTRIHHALGFLGIEPVRDSTVVRAVEPGSLLDLQARMWPFGEVRIVLRLEPEDGGTRVTMEERPVKGPADRVHNPLLALALKLRNTWALRRLARLARARAAASA